MLTRSAAALVAVAVLLGLAGAVPARARMADCFADYGGLIGPEVVVDGNLLVTRQTPGIDPQGLNRGSICQIQGTVQGHVRVFDDSAECNTRPPFTAVELVGGTVLGNIRSTGNGCAMVWLRDGAFVGGSGASLVRGNVVVDAPGNLGFLGNAQGTRLRGKAILNAPGSLLFATGSSNTNRVQNHIVCKGGAPAGGPGTGTPTDWDGLEGPTDPGTDGTIGGRYAC